MSFPRRSFLKSLSRSALVLSLENLLAAIRPVFSQGSQSPADPPNKIPSAAPQLGVFFAVNLVNLGINAGLLYLFVEYLGIWYIAAQLIAAILIAFESYFVYRAIFR